MCFGPNNKNKKKLDLFGVALATPGP